MLFAICARSQCIILLSILSSVLLGVWLLNRNEMDESMLPELQRAGVHIKNIAKVKSLLKEFVSGGTARLQVVADFDRTISKYKHNGEIVPTCHSVINSNELMPESFKKTAADLFTKYYPIEINHNLTPEEKVPHMIEWWTQAHELMMGSGLKRSTLDTMIRGANIILRDGSSAMFSSLRDHQVPLLIFSAGVGDVIDGLLRNRNEFHDNMKIVSNFMDFNSEGDVIGFKGEIIHIYNKNEGAIHDSDYFKELVDRKNVLLLGDSIGDLTMARGVEDGNILRIGFLNDKVEERLENYTNLYDVVLTGDETMDIPNAILREVFG